MSNTGSIFKLQGGPATHGGAVLHTPIEKIKRNDQLLDDVLIAASFLFFWQLTHVVVTQRATKIEERSRKDAKRQSAAAFREISLRLCALCAFA
jgi:hypothetical protein